MKTYCFDIDGVICRTVKGRYKSSKPNKKIIYLINELYKKNKIYIHTARYMGRTEDNIVLAKKLAKKLTLHQLSRWGVKYHKIFFSKPSYDYMIDDKSIYAKKIPEKDIQKQLKKYI
ncbi:phosphoheptose isomerase [Candidatus Pelagibacter sp.]|nr:phosphoheptose isomerase [Candidatus Pelagibacter sp.]